MRDVEDVLGREEYRQTLDAHEYQGSELTRDQLLAHDAALRGLLAECRAVVADAVESPVEVHRRYRQEFAKLVHEIDRAVRADTEGADRE